LPRFSQLASYLRSRTLGHASTVCLLGLLAACGADAEARYAGLSTAEIRTPELTYKIRYLSPPWKRFKDALTTGARKSVPVGGELRDIVPDTGLVLAIERETSFDEVGLTYAKYVMEIAAVRCSTSELTNEDTCARYLAAIDYTARAESGEDSGFFGPEELPGSNDVGQQYYELMTRDPETFRYRRVAFFETADRLLTVRLYIEANPGLADPETSRMIQTLEIVEPGGTVEAGRTGVGP
jgi:hypothetical protein